MMAEYSYLQIKLTAQYELTIKRAQTPDHCALLVRLQVIGRQSFLMPPIYLVQLAVRMLLTCLR